MAASLNNLAELLHTLARYEEAEPLYRRALQVLEQVLGSEYPTTVKVVWRQVPCPPANFIIGEHKVSSCLQSCIDEAITAAQQDSE